SGLAGHRDGAFTQRIDRSGRRYARPGPARGGCPKPGHVEDGERRAYMAGGVPADRRRPPGSRPERENAWLLRRHDRCWYDWRHWSQGEPACTGALGYCRWSEASSSWERSVRRGPRLTTSPPTATTATPACRPRRRAARRRRFREAPAAHFRRETPS